MNCEDEARVRVHRKALATHAADLQHHAIGVDLSLPVALQIPSPGRRELLANSTFWESARMALLANMALTLQRANFILMAIAPKGRTASGFMTLLLQRQMLLQNLKRKIRIRKIRLQPQQPKMIKMIRLTRRTQRQRLRQKVRPKPTNEVLGPTRRRLVGRVQQAKL